MKYPSLLILAGILSANAPFLSAAQADRSARPTEEAEIDEIRSIFQARHQAVGAPAGEEEARKTARELAEQFKSAARKAKAFRSKYSDAHPKVAESKRLEAKALLSATLAGDETVRDEANAAVERAGADNRIPLRERFELALLREFVRRQKWAGDPEKLLEERERSAFRLIEEFPKEAGGYEVLLREAESHPNGAKSQSMAQALLSMPAPESIKHAAQVLVDRYKLIGKPVVPLLHKEVSTGSPFTRAEGRPIILYTWASWSPGSIAIAKLLPEKSPGYVLVGLCLDADITLAKEIAEQQSLPGEQIFDKLGSAGEISIGLKATLGLPIYAINPGGFIVCVDLERGDFGAKLSIHQ